MRAKDRFLIKRFLNVLKRLDLDGNGSSFLLEWYFTYYWLKDKENGRKRKSL